MAQKPPQQDPFARRRAGLLLHLSSLPGPQHQGIIGHDAFRLVEWMAAAGLSVWQTLPLAPTHEDGSPYHALSAHALDPGFISHDWLRDRGLLKVGEDELRLAHGRFAKQARADMSAEYKNFKRTHRDWLDDYALFMVLRQQQQHRGWLQWPGPLRDRDTDALKAVRREHQEDIEYQVFLQYIAYAQWRQLKDYANQHGILMFGDIPIYVALDSADVWTHRELFQLNKQGRPSSVAGVPPDYFSETGQRWGNPLYQWNNMKTDGFSWWSQRIQSQLELFDLMRIDHFRGLEAYWKIPADCETAIDGKWVKAPGKALLQQLQKHFGRLPLVAEDLGVITEAVDQLREAFQLPGMKILQFAFDGNPNNAYLPHNHTRLSVVYTGTHDNDTTESWYSHLDDQARQYIDEYLGPGFPDESISHRLIRTALASTAQLTVLPMQDLLGLGEGHRMNTPGTSEGNWGWRFEWVQVPESLAPDLKHQITLYNRLVSS